MRGTQFKPTQFIVACKLDREPSDRRLILPKLAICDRARSEAPASRSLGFAVGMDARMPCWQEGRDEFPAHLRKRLCDLVQRAQKLS